MATTNIITIEHAKIRFRNFSGKEGRYNPKGDRNFCVFLDSDEFARELLKDGWNVRWLEPRDPDDKKQPYLKVSVNFDNYAPRIVIISNNKKTDVKADSVNILDWAEIENCDLIIRPYNWDVNQKTGVKAYLKTMYVTIVEDELESKYKDVPDSASSSLHLEDEPPF